MTAFRLLITKKISRAFVINSGLRGVEIMEKEFIKISPVNSQDLTEKIKNLSSQKMAVAFTSKNAVSVIASVINSDNNSLPDWKVFCLDGVTRDEVAKRFSKDIIEGTARNAKSLASIILKDNFFLWK